MGRLDDWLQDRPEKPRVENPSLSSQDFADLWNDTQYANFRNFVHKYRTWIDEAIEAPNRAESIEKWRRVFGDDFAKGENVKKAEASVTDRARVLLMDTAAHLDGLVDTVIDYGVGILPSIFNRPPHQQAPPWPMAETVSRNVQVFAEHSGTKLKGRGHRISSGRRSLPVAGSGSMCASTSSRPFHLTATFGGASRTRAQPRWPRSAGEAASKKPTEGDRRWEGLQYRGVHMAEAFIIRRRDDRVVGQSDPFYVVIK
ncbi:hypothetical protein [Sinorhizobium psoraleae]|uniref:hypothetical protein n=1 Tax=Sinorhizobium psoraleae TaxID=520838 RepID=UPI00406B9322